jgi:hypothetical protein
MTQGSGKIQQRSRLITEKQIIDTLLQGPSTFKEMREKTHIQPTTLHDILENYVKKGMTFKHELSINKQTVPLNSSRIKIGVYYYLLNLDNKKIQQLIADQTPLRLKQYLKDYKNSTDIEEKKYGQNIIRKIDSLSLDVDPYYYCSEKLFEDTIDNTDRDFPHTKVQKEQIQKISFKSDLEFEKVIKVLKKETKEQRFEDIEYARKQKPLYLDAMVIFMKNNYGSSIFDFLIHICCILFDSTSNNINNVRYRTLWKVATDYMEQNNIRK